MKVLVTGGLGKIGSWRSLGAGGRGLLTEPDGGAAIPEPRALARKKLPEQLDVSTPHLDLLLRRQQEIAGTHQIGPDIPLDLLE